MRALLLASVVGLVAACTPDYPMDKPGTWSLDSWGSANDANLRAMVVNPSDLTGGRGEANSVGVEAAQPVKRLFTGNRYPLPQLSADDLTGSNTQPQQPQPQGNNNP